MEREKTLILIHYQKYSSEFIPSEIRKLAKDNVLYNNLRLGVVNTKLHKKLSGKKISQKVKLIPIKRTALKEEVVKLINYFINQNTYIASQNISISGGE